ncbi:WD40 repeat domain-containing serine/threonine protein kinase [[Actinomadura] parvosata]|uniref:WD40 repeat domain-containing serine/threonine protein kinase n=1 Tax=[Actinomadura] parvosata TaxID=1955412 RepID=UPI00406CFDC1
MDPLLPGDPPRIGGYWLAGRLGAGGQGVVYEAYDDAGTRVAVKVLHAEARDRFAKEAEAARRVASFCTTKVLAVDLDGDKPYIVSEFVPGQSLRRVVQGGRRFAGDDLYRLATAVATALTAVHDAGVIHRDLKPDNVLLGPDGPRVIDFGIARTDDMSLTRSGEVKGTPSYMAPEVFTGQRAGAAADVFAWGAVVVFAATGEDPFHADNLGGVMHRVLSAQPDLSALPSRLAGLVAAALEKDPAARPTARDLLLALVSGAGSDVRSLLAAGSRSAAGMYVPDASAPELGTIAEDVYASLAPEERELAAEVFLRLVTVTEDGHETIRWAAVDELTDGRPEIGRILDRFGYLLTQRDGAVALSRPALLRAWLRLRGWVDADRAGLATLAQLTAATRHWLEHGRKDGDLLQGSRLEQVLTWAAAGRTHVRLTSSERSFLQAATVLTRRRAARRRLITAALAGLLVIAVVAGGVAFVQGQRAAEQGRAVARQRDQAVGRQVAAQADRLRTTDPVAAMLLSVAGWRLAPGPDTRRSLMGSLTMPERAAFHDPAVKGVSASASAAAGRIRVVASEDGVRVYDVPGRRQRASWTWPRGFAALPGGAALSPSGATLVVLDGLTMSAWDTMTGRKLREHPVSEGTPRPDLAFGDNEDLVSVTRSGSVELVWNVRTGRTYEPRMEATPFPAIPASGAYVAGWGLNEGMKVIRLSDLSVLPWSPRKCQAIAFSPDGTRMYCANGAIQTWDTRTGRRISGDDEPFWAGSEEGGRLWVSADGTRLLGLLESTIRVWNAANGEELFAYHAEGEPEQAWIDGTGTVRYLLDHAIVTLDAGSHGMTARLPDQARIAGLGDGPVMIVARPDDLLRTWDGRRLGPPLPGSQDVAPIEVDPQGRRLVGVRNLTTVRAWDLTTRRASWSWPVPRMQSVVDLAFTPDGGRLVLSLAENSERNARNELLVLDAASGKVLKRHRLDTATGTIEVTSSGTAVVTNVGRMLDLGTGKLTGSGFNSGESAAIAVSRTRPLAAFGSAAVQLWDHAQGVELSPLLRPAGALTVSDIAFSHDSSLVAAVSSSREDAFSVHVWDVATRQELAAVPIGFGDELRFSADDGVLYAGVRGYPTITTIPVRGDAVAALVCERAGRTLSAREWSQYLGGVPYRDPCARPGR